MNNLEMRQLFNHSNSLLNVSLKFESNSYPPSTLDTKFNMRQMPIVGLLATLIFFLLAGAAAACDSPPGYDDGMEIREARIAFPDHPETGLGAWPAVPRHPRLRHQQQ